MRDFRQYEIWTNSVSFATDVYKLTASFPKYETYGLRDQLQRAAVSISSNIAEGFSRDSSRDFSHFLEIAIGSAFEVETQLKISLNLNYINEEQYTEMVTKLSQTERQIHSLINKLRDK